MERERDDIKQERKAPGKSRRLKMSRQRNTNHKRKRLHQFVDMFGCRVKLADVIVSARLTMPVHWWRYSGAAE